MSGRLRKFLLGIALAVGWSAGAYICYRLGQWLYDGMRGGAVWLFLVFCALGLVYCAAFALGGLLLAFGIVKAD